MGRTEQARTTDVDFYTQPSAMTSPGSHGPLLSELPNEVADLARIIQHLVVYDVVAPGRMRSTRPDTGQCGRTAVSVPKLLRALDNQ